MKMKTYPAVWLKAIQRLVFPRSANSQDLQRILHNVGWLFADRMLRLAGGLLVGVWVARYLGPDQFGLLNYSLAFAAIFMTVATLGMDGIVIRNIVRNPRDKDEILGTAFVLRLAGGLIATALAGVSIYLLRPNDSTVQVLVGISVIGSIFQALDVVDYWFQSQVLSKFTVYAKNGAFLIIAIAKVILILVKAPLIYFACAWLGEIVIGSIGLVIVYRLIERSPGMWRFSKKLAEELLRDSWPLIFSGLVIMIYMRVDQIMIGEMVGNSEVGIYSSAVRLAEVWYFIPGVIVASVFPSIVEAKAVSDELFYQRLQRLYNLMALLGYAVALPVTFLGGWIINLLYGAAYAKAGPMLSLLIWAGIFVNLGVARSSFLTTMNWTKIYFVTVLLGCIINVALNIILIPRYGGLGAVVASCVGYWFAVHGACSIYRPLHPTGRMLTRALVYPKIW